MERLPQWLQSDYDALWDKFGRQPFSQEEVMAGFTQKQTNVADFLSGLQRAGYLVKEIDPIDQRMRSYRLVDVARARQLDERLESWRLQAGREAVPLADAIDRTWEQVQSVLSGQVDLSAAPPRPGHLATECAAGKASLADLRVVKAVQLDHLPTQEQPHFLELLKLYDASSNAYRSVTNVLLEYEKLHRDLAAGMFDLWVGDYAAVDGTPLKPPRRVADKSLCPVCRRFEQRHTALALITGNPKMDSAFQTLRASQSTRASMKVCGYCFLAGWVDLPAARITKDGQSVGKGREYLFVTTPLSRDDLQRLLAAISRSDLEGVAMGGAEGEEDAISAATTVAQREEHDLPADSDEQEPGLAALSRFLNEKYGIEGFDDLAVLGVSTHRLRELRGFVLPSANPLNRVVAVRVPVERLVGEDKVSGAVRRELVKATMYDFWMITGGSLHYNRITDWPFSVDGVPVEVEDMRRASIAYRMADRYARVGRYRQLNSGLFMRLLSQPRLAANTILRARHRTRRFAPGREKVKEVIELTESIARNDWKFDLGLRIVGVLVEVGLLKKAESFRFGAGPNDVHTGVELVKWLQRLKMIRDEPSARAWGNMLLNALKRGDVAYKGYIEARGGQVTAPGRERVAKILDLVDGDDGIIRTCSRHGGKLSELAREIADMDYYLLFYYNQRQAALNQDKEDVK